jgi:hypothetical protein
VGMTLEEVEALLGLGEEIEEMYAPHVVDWTQPLDSPKRLRPVVCGEKIYRWTDSPNDGFGDRKVLISFVGGRVKEKWYWEPSL